jgi:hypothetical protein
MEIFQKAEDVCKIIIACRRAGVTRLKLGTMEVDFLPSVLKLARQEPIPGAAPTPAAQVPGQTIQAAERIEREAIEEEGINVREDQIAELLITDPLLAEKMMEEGDLIAGESKDGSGDDDGE